MKVSDGLVYRLGAARGLPREAPNSTSPRGRDRSAARRSDDPWREWRASDARTTIGSKAGMHCLRGTVLKAEAEAETEADADADCQTGQG